MRLRIVLTGGPASGKTTALNLLKEDKDFRDFAFLEELARQLLAANPAYRNDKDRFHAEIYRQQSAREAELGGKSFITDRGTIDAFAFHPETIAQVGTSLSNEYKRYDAVFQLGSSASLGFPYYKTDDIRLETIKEALEIESAIKEVWRSHPDYHFIDACEEFMSKFSSLREILLNKTKTQAD